MKKLTLNILILMISVLAGCGSEPETTRVAVNIGGKSLAASSLPLLVYYIDFTISAPDMDAISRVVQTKGKSGITENFDVPLGKDRRFFVQALDFKKRPVYSGEAYKSLSGPPVTVNIVMTKVDKAVPTTPYNFSAYALSHNRIGLSWDASSDDVGVEGYYVYKGDTLLASVPPSSLSFSDTGLYPSTEYCYSVSAYDRIGNESGRSKEKCAFTSSVLTVWSWGNNSIGQLGDGSMTERLTPVEAVGLTDVSAISAAGGNSGGYSFGHSLAIGPNRRVYSWGYNEFGQLGDSTNTNKYTPTASQLPEAISIAAGENHSLAVSKDGWAYAWGDNYYGKLGCEGEINCPPPGSWVNWPQRVTLYDLPSYLINASAVAAGANHSLALKTDGTVWAWGRNNSGQLGYDPVIKQNSVRAIQVQGITNAVAIAAGGDHSLALLYNGTVLAWGSNNDGQLGDGGVSGLSSSTPVNVNIANVNAIAAGAGHSLALISNGTVWSWGANYSGQLGDGTTENKLTPVQVSGLTNVTAISAGTNHSLARKSDWTVRAWGDNSYGQLGNGYSDISPYSTPIQVKGLRAGTMLTDALDIKAGKYFSLALIVIDNQPPSGTYISATDSTLTWYDATDDYKVASYRIYRSSNQVDWELVTTVSELSYTVTDSGNYYLVNAVDLRGNESSPSNILPVP